MLELLCSPNQLALLYLIKWFEQQDKTNRKYYGKFKTYKLTTQVQQTILLLWNQGCKC